MYVYCQCSLTVMEVMGYPAVTHTHSFTFTLYTLLLTRTYKPTQSSSNNPHAQVRHRVLESEGGRPNTHTHSGIVFVC